MRKNNLFPIFLFLTVIIPVVCLLSCQTAATTDNKTAGGTTPTLLDQYFTNLVAEYLFDGDAADTSGKNNNGTVYGATADTDRLGRSGKAYSFYSLSSNSIVCSNGFSLMSLSTFSVAFWIKTTNFSDNGRIIGTRYGANGWEIDIWGATSGSPARTA